MIKLSVLDQSPISSGSNAVTALANTTKLAREVEKLGYHRFWVSEHHYAATLAGSSPEVLISHLAGQTKTLRIGSGGIMLPHYSSYKVAENFRLLEALYPNRIDLGLGRAPGGMPLATRALQEYKLKHGVDIYPEQLDDLIDYLHDSLDEKHRFADLVAMPVIETAPEFWLLGSSGDSAVLAARRGAGFAFAQFINGDGGVDAMLGYLQKFQPSILGDKPRTMVAIFAVCAETEEEANRLASSLDLTILMREKGEKPSWVGTPSVEQAQAYPYTSYDRQRIQFSRNRMIVGNQAQVKAQILKLSEEYQTKEFMIVTNTHDFQAKLDSYRLLADAFKS